MERKLDPLTTKLVVADASRTEKTICLAVSPALKAYGIPGRARLFEVVQKAKEFSLSYITATPRMAKYMEYSTNIYHIYLNYIAPEDIHVYSIDEVFMDVTEYLKTYEMTPRELAGKMIQDVYQKTGITATAGIGTNLYLCKVAMDIVAKHVKEDENGVRIAELDEMEYRRLLWNHKPLTDFWRVGRGYVKKLEEHGLFTMGDIARCSLGKPGDYYKEDLLYQLFGINAELLIDHAWGWEPCTIADVKSYKPSVNSLGTGQVLKSPYEYEKAKLVVKEMTEQLALDLIEKQLVTDQIVLTVGYDIANLSDTKVQKNYQGEVTTDRYGRKVPKHAHGTANLGQKTSSAILMVKAIMNLYETIVDTKLLVRRINLAANHVTPEKEIENNTFEQMDIFSLMEEHAEEKQMEKEKLEREKKIQQAILTIKKKYGKNAVLKGTSFEEGATTRDRNKQIGGHKA